MAPAQIAENVIALVILPKVSSQDTATGVANIASQYEYDSRDTGKSATLNQLPPLVEVVMVAIDEVSARRLENGSSAVDFGVSGLFRDASMLDADLKTLEGKLADKNVKYQVFRTTVALRNSKWSS